MKKILFFLLVISIGIFSCNKEVQPLTKEQIKQKTDSLIQARIQESDNLARVDLDRRLKIEVKVKVDSILNARAQKEVKKDTAKKKSSEK